MIHQYKLGGYNIVLDVCSGGVHVVDEVAYDIIAMFETHSRKEVLRAMGSKYPSLTEAELEECYAQVESLKDAGKLFAPDTFGPMAGQLKQKTAGVVKALCLHVAHTCNLNCSYCFASQGKYHGERAMMSFEVGKRALDFLIENSGTRKNLEVDFFGGVLVDDEVIQWANKECSNVVLSLDGRKEIHDRFRVDYAGNGSWEKIVPKFQKFVQARGGKDYYMRGTFTHNNPDFLKDIQQMLDLGFTELSMEPVVCAAGDPSALPEEDLPLLPLYDRPHRRPLHLQADFRLRQRHGVHGGDPLGRPVPLPSVRGGGAVPAGQYLGRGDQHRGAGRVRRLQRLRPPGVPGLLGAAVLLRRLRGKRLSCHRQRHRCLRIRLQAVPQAHGVRHHGSRGPGIGGINGHTHL